MYRRRLALPLQRQSGRSLKKNVAIYNNNNMKLLNKGTLSEQNEEFFNVKVRKI
jgi:hypothetical protein